MNYLIVPLASAIEVSPGDTVEVAFDYAFGGPLRLAAALPPGSCGGPRRGRRALVTVDTRKLVMGDWSPIVRDPLDVLRLVFAVAAAGFAAAGDAAGAFNLALAFAVLVAARLANLPRVYDLAAIVALTFTQGGEALNLYDAIAWYDRVVHVVVPLLSVPDHLPLPRADRGHAGSQPGDAAPPRGRHVHRRVRARPGGRGAVEIFEWSSDGLFGSNLSEGNTDTVGDLIADACGSLAGGGLMVLWAKRGWGSVRRIPGENRREDTTGLTQQPPRGRPVLTVRRSTGSPEQRREARGTER